MILFVKIHDIGHLNPNVFLFFSSRTKCETSIPIEICLEDHRHQASNRCA